MPNGCAKTLCTILLLAGVTSVMPTGHATQNATAFSPNIPKVWDEDLLRTVELPLAPPAPQPTHVPAAYYYSIPVLTI
jgi:hypothetical protein